jgi:hypothetical protein
MADPALSLPTTRETATLQIDLEGMALLRSRLRAANAQNPAFGAQYKRLLELLHTVSRGLEREFPDTVDRVLAVGDWARQGLDLRNLPLGDVVLLVVLSVPNRPFDLYLRVAEKVFSDLGDEDIGIQFQLATAPEWQSMADAARQRGVAAAPGIPLFVRA